MTSDTEAEHIEDEEDFRKIEQLISLNNFSLAMNSYRAKLNDFNSEDLDILNRLLDYYTNTKHQVSIDPKHLNYYRSKKYPIVVDIYPIQLNLKKLVKHEYILNSAHKLNTVDIHDYTTYPEFDNKHLALFFRNDDYLLESLLSDVCKLNYCLKTNPITS